MQYQLHRLAYTALLGQKTAKTAPIRACFLNKIAYNRCTLLSLVIHLFYSFTSFQHFSVQFCLARRPLWASALSTLLWQVLIVISYTPQASGEQVSAPCSGIAILSSSRSKGTPFGSSAYSRSLPCTLFRPFLLKNAAYQ